MSEPNSKTVMPTFSDTPSVRLRVFGGFSLCDVQNKPIELTARKGRQLLAYLAIPPGQVRTREQLIELLWSDRQEEQARGSLRNALSGIRRAIGDDALIVEHDTVRLRTGSIVSDYDSLRKLLVNQNNISKLQDFYAGEVMAGLEHDSELFTDWLRNLRSESKNFAISVLEKAADKLAKDGEYKPAIDLLRESLSLEPLIEQTHRTIMTLYAANGEKGMAMAQFRTCKEVLLHELKVDPDSETIALADRIALKDESKSKALRQNASSKQNGISEHVITLENSDDNSSSIAVIPFVNMSGDAEQNYFADGITEDIIVDLCCVDSLSVAAKSSSEIYRGASISAAQISQELGVRYILEGSIRKAGNSVRVSALLVDGKTSRQIWAKRFDRKLENIFELQSEISQEIVKALELNLTGLEQQTTDRRTTSSAEAYQCYLRGRTLLKLMSNECVHLAQSLFERAVQIDPNYALAYTGIADCATTLFCHYDVDSSFYDKALAACDKAQEINPTLAEAYASRGYILQFGDDIAGSEENLERAISLNPKLGDAYYYLGLTQIGLYGDVEKAYVIFKQGFEIDQEIRLAMMLLTCLQSLNRPTELRSIAGEILSIAERRIASNPLDLAATHVMAQCLQSLGDLEGAKYWANIAASFDTQDGRSMYNLACLQAQLGAIDESLDLLEQVLELGCSKAKIQYLKVLDPDLNAVRKDPRFEDLIARF